MNTKSRVCSFMLSVSIGIGIPAAFMRLCLADEPSFFEPGVKGVESKTISFETDVRPIFKAMCFQCHGEEVELSGGLDLRLVRLMTHGGDSGAGLIVGESNSSLLWQRIESDEMPEGMKKLSAAQKQTIRRWIDAGCKTARPEPANVEDAKYTAEELGHWSFQPARSQAVPTTNGVSVASPIDAFIAEKQAASGLAFSPEAKPASLLRRLYLSLTGVPPAPADVDRYTADNDANAYEKVVDRLLDSSDYGVRWARHWLDVAGYAESEGNMDEDTNRDYAWKYRDYVVDSFNADKPYDHFLREQIAGDEMIGGPPDPENDRHVELMTATAFLLMAPNVTEKNDTLIDRNQAIADTLKVVSASVLGLTVGCAQCHDHRYDPISAEDYYRFRAVFDPAFPLESWTKPTKRKVDLTPSKDRLAAQDIEAKAIVLETDLKSRRTKKSEEIFDSLVSQLPAETVTMLKSALEKSKKDRTPEEVELVEKNPMIQTIDFISKHILLYDEPKYREFEKQELEIAALRETKPAPRMVMAIFESQGPPPESALFFRGDPLQRKQVVGPGELFVAARGRQLQSIQTDDSSATTTGRRMAYANQLTDGTHPLVARVAVNRIWMHHFGRGLVATPSDFGLFGERPTHPELLDFLATQFVDSGWSMKKLHKAIVMSQTFRQSSTRTALLESKDPDNLLLARMNLTRLDAETIRDSILSVTGLLNEQLGGPSVPVAADQDGKTVIGKLKLKDDLFDRIEDVGSQKYRRSLYIQVHRSKPLNMLETFDQPAMVPNCDSRKCSTVAPQSLWFLNDQLIVSVSDSMAEMLYGDSYPDPESRVNEVFRRLYGVSSTAEEMAACLKFLEEQSRRFHADSDEVWQKTLVKRPKAANVRALACLCQTLISTNRFIYGD